MNELPETPFLTSEIKDLGISPKQLRALVKACVVRRVLYGVYARSDLPDTQELRAACAAKVLPSHCVVSDRSAAWLHRVECFELAELSPPPVLEVVSWRGNDRTRRGGVLGGKRELVASDICFVNGVPVTTPLRTACDLACQRGRLRALAVLDAFRRRFGLTIADFLAILPRYARRRGVIQLRELIPLSNPLAESFGESWTRGTIIDEKLPVPESQVWVYLEELGEWVRLDLAYPHLKICVEYDGEEFHTEPEDKERDERRRDALRRAGWIVIVVRKDGFKGPAREAWLGELRRALAERTPVPGKRVYSRGDSSAYPRRRPPR